jgi:hypothetical protein
MKKAFVVMMLAMLFALTATGMAAPVTERIKMDHFGYRPTDTKIAIFTIDPGATVQVRNTSDAVVFTVPTNGGSITAMGPQGQPTGDTVWQVNFTPFATAGTYRLYVPSLNQQSYDFRLDPAVYNDVGKVALKTFYYQRCGVAHSQPYAAASWSDPFICHAYLTAVTAAQGETNYGTLDLSGGWHDAGDYNKYIWGDTALAMVGLVSAYEINPAAWPDGQLLVPRGNNGVPDIVDEMKVEVDWLLKMQMPDGKVLSRVWDDAAGAPDPVPPSNAINPHFYYAPDLESGAIFTGSVAAFARLCDSLGDPYGNVAALKTAARKTWNDYLVGQSEAANAWGGGWKLWAAAEVWRMDPTVTSAKVYVETRYADWATAYMQGYMPNNAAVFAYLQTPGADPTIVAKMKTALGARVDEWFNYRAGYRNEMNGSYYHWGSNKVFGSWGVQMLQAVRLGAMGTHTAAEIRDFAQDWLHYLHGQNPLGMTYLTIMSAYGGEHSSYQFFHYWFGAIKDAESVAWYRGKPSAIVEPDYPYFKGLDNYNVSDNNASLYGPAPGFIVGGSNKDYSGMATPPSGATYYAKFYRDWIDNSPNGFYRTKVWEVNENSISYQGPYIGLIAGFMSAGTGSTDQTPPPVPSGLTATAVLSTQVNVDWADVSAGDLFGYNVYRSGTSGGPYKLVYGGVTTSSFSDYKVSPSNTYYYVVTSLDTSGNESANSAQASATTPGSSNTMHVTQMVSGSQKGQNPGAWLDVFVKSDTNAVVPNATVTVVASGLDTKTGQQVTETKTGVTDSLGKARVTTIVNQGTMCVTNVTHATYTYDSNQNLITCVNINY